MRNQDDITGLIERAWQLELRQIALATALDLASRKLAFCESYAGALDQVAGALERISQPGPGNDRSAESPVLPPREHRPGANGGDTRTSLPLAGRQRFAVSASPVNLGYTQNEQAIVNVSGSPDRKSSAWAEERPIEQSPLSPILSAAAMTENLSDQAAVRVLIDKAVSQERLRLARRIHDGLMQEVTSLVLGLEAAQRAAVKDPTSIIEGISQTQQSARSCLSETRRFLAELRSEPPVATGLLIALQRLVEEFRQEEGLPVSFQWSGLYSDVSWSVEQGVLGVVQEALTNAKKHSQAHTVIVSFRFAADAIEGLIFDDGQGFDPTQSEKAARRGDSFGIVSMRQRMDALGGDLRLDSTTGKGTRVELRVPLGQGTLALDDSEGDRRYGTCSRADSRRSPGRAQGTQGDSSG